MGNFLNNNIELIKKSFPHVYQVISESQFNETNLNIYSDQTKNGLVNLKVEIDNIKVYLHSNYDPDREISTILTKHKIDDKDTIIVFGFGLGYHLEQIFKQYPTKKVVVIEPSPRIFIEAINCRDITHILELPQLQLLVTEDIICVNHDLYVLYNLGNISKVEFIELPSYYRLFGKNINEIKVNFSKVLLQNKVNVITEMLLTKNWVNNFFQNLINLPESADLVELKDQFKNVPAIMVSAGPSLEKNLHLLKDLENKAIIIANGSTVSILEKHGIKPHFMIGIDGHEKMSEIFTKVKWDDVIFTYVLNLHHASLDYYKGPKVYIKTNAEPLANFMEDSLSRVTPTLVSGGSCANVSIDFIKSLGCNPIIMIGQDLAFTNMEMYAEGHSNKTEYKENTLANNMKSFKKSIDIYGKEIYTSDSLLSMKNGLENFIAKTHDTLIINATEGGLPIQGAENFALQEVIEKYCSNLLNIKEKLQFIIDQSTKENRKIKNKLEEMVKNILDQCKALDQISQKRINFVNKILLDIKNGKVSNNNNDLKRLNQLTASLEKEIIFTKLINPIARNLLVFLNRKSENEANETNNLVEKLRILYDGLKSQFLLVEEVNNLLIEGSEKALERLKHEVEA